ncbi:acyl-ACP thioesterase domain-containing protein [Facklamia sp. 7083-14-GEN3]|uniref:acyl-ACP thioesterase domain-containing protein n=1 Tax=Facklamia sp. 7083-14-GEN3 TaxID=2973478 RepID=UPI00215D00DD|nr:acyl-ACP thioesterase domain-containing protein [Facklamia sp. 7083-14-GEN3]MCR8969497.1 thioesterase [Facklamia sp. 7083-14-GEN3]
MSEKVPSYTQTFKINSDWFIDREHKSNNFTKLLEAILETSTNHEQFNQFDQTDTILGQDESWVITQNVCIVNQLPRYGDIIEIKTKIIQANRFLLERWFEIRSKDHLLLECQIQFAVINLKTRKMGRINHKMLEELKLIDHNQHVKKIKLTFPEDITFCQENDQVIIDKDIDFNNHVNNLVYINWSISNLPIWLQNNYYIKNLAIKYGRELLREHQVKIRTEANVKLETRTEADKVITYQTIYNDTIQQEAARIEIEWLKKEL